jgi:hypothetical protein
MKNLWRFSVGLVACLALVTTGCWSSTRQAPTTQTKGECCGKGCDESAPAEPAALTNGQELVTAPQSASVDLTVYGNRFAQVEETRRVTLKPGANRILLSGIASRYRPDSLRVISAKLAGTNVLNPEFAAERKGKHGKTFTYLSATYQPANLTPDRLLADSIGKRLTIKTPTGAGLDAVTGVLVNVTGNTAVVKTNSGTSIVPVSGATLVSTPTGLSNTASLVLEAWADVGGDFDLNFLYDTDGITWNAKHSLIYDDAQSNVESWESSVAIVNGCGTSFSNATVRLLSGNVASRGEGRMYAASMAGGPGGSPNTADAAVESVGDQKSYTLPGSINLVDGQSRQVPLFSSANVPVKREYFIPSANFAYYGAQGKQEVSVRLEVDNCEKKNMGKPIPAGPVKVYQRNKAGKLQLTGSANVGYKAADEIFQMVIGTAPDIKWESMLVERKEATPPTTKPAPAKAVRPPATEQEEVWESHTYKIVVSNFNRDRDVEVLVEISFPTDQTLPQPWTLKENIQQAHTTLTVPKSGQSEVRYTVKERVR